MLVVVVEVASAETADQAKNNREVASRPGVFPAHAHYQGKRIDFRLARRKAYKATH